MTRLRKCSAHVNKCSHMFCNAYELVSYSTPVALYGMVDGEIVDAYGEIHTCEGMALLVNPNYDCSVTTMMHVRKFIEDYVGARVAIAEIRDALKTDNVLCCQYGGDVHVYLIDDWG